MKRQATPKKTQEEKTKKTLYNLLNIEKTATKEEIVSFFH